MYTNGQIIINATSADLIRDGHSIVESFEEVQEKSWYKLNEDQKTFKQANPDSDITEVIACQLGKFTFDKVKQLKIKEIEDADKAASLFYINNVPMWLSKELRSSLLTVTLPALKQAGRTTIKLWNNDIPPVFVDVDIDWLIDIIPQLDIQSNLIYNRTNTLKAMVYNAIVYSELDNITIGGYPDHLRFTL